MSEFTLPSGQVVEIHEPLFGEELHVVSVGAENIEELVYAKCAVMVPSLTREDIANLKREDGRALLKEIGRIWDGRPEEQEAPFDKKSNGVSKVDLSETPPRENVSTNSA